MITVRGAMPLGHIDTGPTRALWKDCPWDSLGQPGTRGTKFWDDFTGGLGNWATFVDTGGTLLGDVTAAADALGVITGTTDADDNQGIELQAVGASVVLNDPAVAAVHSVWFETRFKLGALVGNSFFGVMAPFVPAGDHITDAGALADKDFVGFATLEAAPTLLTFTYKKEGQTVQVPIASLATLVAGTYIKVGFTYSSINPTSTKILVYKDSVKQATGVTATQIAAATFPDSEPMAPTIAKKNVTDIDSFSCDWIAAAMLES